ncbi:hypothetical protein [Microbacterium sp.]|uniref:hypothetical protein n=1 Tax=Microbacterium sp. TaxID=51671 RepID=UPI00333F433F
MLTTPDTYTRLSCWAAGSLTDTAAVELLGSALGGRLLNGPWIRHDEHGNAWFDPQSAVADSGYLSGGERRVLAIAASLIAPDSPVDLGDAITGIDSDTAQHVLHTLALAAGLPTPDTTTDEEH